MYDNVRPDKMIKALSWLKANNTLYRDVDINMDWCEDSVSDNCDLYNSLTGQCERINVLRNVVTEYDEHYNILVDMANTQIFLIHDVIGNGDCLFSSVCYQLNGSMDCLDLRSQTVHYLRDNPYINDVHLSNFLDLSIAGDTELSVDDKWELYLQQLQDGAWGDNICLQVISNMFVVYLHHTHHTYPHLCHMYVHFCHTHLTCVMSMM